MWWFTKVSAKFGGLKKKHYLCNQTELSMEPNATTYKGKGRHSSVSLFSFETRPQGVVPPVVLPLNDEKSRIKIALDKLSYLKAGWDGLDAAPISKEVIYNVLQMLLVSDNQVWHDWSVEPNINGTLLLRSCSHLSAISIGKDSFSYFIKNGRDITGKDDVPFSADTILDIMWSLSNKKKKYSFPCRDLRQC